MIHFILQTLSRKDKKDIKRRQAESLQALNNITDIGDIGEFEELNDLSAKLQNNSHENYEKKSKKGKATSDGVDAVSALQRAVSAFASNNALSKPSGGRNTDDVEDVFADTAAKKKKTKARIEIAESEDDGFDDYDEGENYDHAHDENYDDEFDKILANGDGSNSKKRRRPAPSADDDEEDGLLEAFSEKKKEFAKKKKDFYTVAPRTGGREELVEDGHKRGISYEIMANKGLTPHRKKSNRNPRVKKREAYEKAVKNRKGQVRDVISGAAGAYGGEKTGIKSNVSRSRKLET